MAMEREHIQTYVDLFCHRRDLYAQQRDNGAYFLKRQRVDEAVIRSHLNGEFTAGWYALAKDSSVRWVCLDADGEHGLEQLQQASAQLQARKKSSQLERSRRGGHLWLLFEPIPARVARQFVLGLLPELHLIEVFPKRDQLDTDSRVGNLVRGPLGIHRMTGERYPFVDPISLKPVSRTVRGTLEYLGEAEPISIDEVSDHLGRFREATRQAQPVGKWEPWPPAAPALGKSPIEQIKERIGDPYAFIAQFVELDEAGRGHCPFHPPDVHPSFAVNHAGGYWTDFHELNPRTGRYQGGDVIEFYRRLKGLSYKEAVRDLQELLELSSRYGQSEVRASNYSGFRSSALAQSVPRGPSIGR